MNMFAISFAVMLLVILAELAFLKWSRQQVIPWKEVVFNLNSGHILMWVFRGVEVLVFGWVLQHLSLHWVDGWALPWVWLLAWVGWDFCFYWMHRMHHTWSWLWAVHVVHHQGEHFNLSLGVRNSWYSSLSNLPFVLVLAVIGVPLEIFLLVSSFHYSVQLYNHNALVGKSGWLDKIMVTPSNHRVHHGTAPVYLNKNFGGTLLLWDQLFGTWQPERADVPMQYGVPGSVQSHNPLWANNKRFQRFWTQRFPALQRLAQLAMPGWYIGLGGVLLFGVVIYYVNQDGRALDAQRGVLFAFLFLGTIALGALSDDRRWGWFAWMLLSSTALGATLILSGGREPLGLLLLALCLVHALAGLPRALRSFKPAADATHRASTPHTKALL